MTVTTFEGEKLGANIRIISKYIFRTGFNGGHIQKVTKHYNFI